MKLMIILVAIIAVTGCTGTTQQMGNPGVIENANGTPVQASGEYGGTIIAGKVAPLIDFNKADYDKALQSDKAILLYFYATWCPICKAELPHLYAAFNELNNDRLIGFRVNFNDGDTDDDERAIARQFGVPYQHTKVFIRNGKVIGKFPDSWDKARYLIEIDKAIY